MLVNPVAGRGRAAGFLPAARAALEPIGGATVLATRGQGDEAVRTREALDRGASTIVVLGGDGTVSRVAAELVRAASTTPLAMFGAGTGNDFAKSVPAPVHDFPAMARLIANGSTRTVDAGRVDENIFINSAGFGFDAEVLRRTLKPGLLRGTAVYVTTALGQLLQYKGFAAVVRSDTALANRHPAAVAQNDALSSRWLTLVFANGGWFGGTFRIAPEASITDGVLDAVFINDASPLRRAVLFGRAMRGAHVVQPEVTIERKCRWELEFDASPVYQADGELQQASSRTVVVEVLPAALRMVSSI